MKTQLLKSAIGHCTLAIFTGINAYAATTNAACETVESTRSYLSGLCPADHQDADGNSKTAFVYHCEMMANNDFIVSEISKTTTCDSVLPITTAQATTPQSATRGVAAEN